MRATYKIRELNSTVYAVITLRHKDIDGGDISFFTEQYKTKRGALGAVKRIMKAMNITNFKEVK